MSPIWPDVPAVPARTRMGPVRRGVRGDTSVLRPRRSTFSEVPLHGSTAQLIDQADEGQAGEPLHLTRSVLIVRSHAEHGSEKAIGQFTRNTQLFDVMVEAAGVREYARG